MNCKIYNNSAVCHSLDFSSMGQEKQVGLTPNFAKELGPGLSGFWSLPSWDFYKHFIVSSHIRKSSPLGFLGVFCSLEFQVHPSDNNSFSQIICGTLISSIYELMTLMYTLKMWMGVSLGLPSPFSQDKTPWDYAALVYEGISSPHTAEQHTQVESFLSSILFQCKGQSF